MNKYSLNLKVAIIVGVLIIGSLVISGVSLLQMNYMDQAIDRITDVRVVVMNETLHLRNLFYVQIINERNFILNHAGRSTNKEYLEHRDKEFREALALRMRHTNNDDIKFLEEMKSVYEKWWTVNREIISLVDSGKEQEGVNLIVQKGRELRLAGEAALEKLIALDVKMMSDDRAAAEKVYADAKLFQILISSVSILLGISLALIFMRAISKAISNVIEHLHSSSTQVAQAAQQIASASEGLSGASTEQASSLEETVATLEELTSMVKLNAGNAQEASKLATSAQSIAENGEESIRHLSASMETIAIDS